MAKDVLKVFYAWQSDRPLSIGKNFVRTALDNAAERINADSSTSTKVFIDADTEGLVGTPPVTESILKKINEADVFAPDLTFVAQTGEGKLVPNPNVMIEYGFALRALGFEAMMPVMNVHYGPPESLPFDMGHVRHPLKFNVAEDIKDAERRLARAKLSEQFEGILRLMAGSSSSKAAQMIPFESRQSVRPPAFFFQPAEVIANFGAPGEQEMRFKRDRAVYVRLYPSHGGQPRPGLTNVVERVDRVKPMADVIGPLHTRNDFGAVVLVPHGDGITSFTQVFESGEIWGVSEQPFRSGTHPCITSIGAEKAYTAAVPNFLRASVEAFGLKPPFTLELGATGLRDQYLLVPSQEFPSGEYSGPIRADSISRTYSLQSTDKAEWVPALRDFLNDFYDLAVKRRSEVLTDTQIEANGLVPR